MNRTTNILAIAIATAALSATAVAGGDKHKEAGYMKDDATFTALDADKSGTVTPAEIRNAGDAMTSEKLTDKWAELDTNQDGELDRSEFARFEPVTDDEIVEEVPEYEDYEQ